MQRPGLDSKCFPKTSQFAFLGSTEYPSIPFNSFISNTCMARPERFELPTPWFVARRSAEHLPPFKQLEAIVREACLSRVRDCEARLQALEGSRDRQRELTPEQRDPYLALGEDLQRVWSHESTPPQLRKRLLRAVLVEIIATIKGREIHLLLHWKGGDHSHLVVPRNRTSEHRWTTDAQTER